jgi:hypothetical protein
MKYVVLASLSALLAGSLVFACGGFKIGPFIPENAIPCSWDGDCPVNTNCRFPAVDTHAVCMPEGVLKDNQAMPGFAP